MSVITVKHLNVNYDQIVALTDVDFEVKDKEFLGIIGPNGGGKTTLVKAILGLLEPKSGSIVVENAQILGYVPQMTTFDRQFPISVKEVILMGHLPRHIKIAYKCSPHEKAHAKTVMERLGIYQLRDRQIGQLSGGQMQRVLIARALMNHPTILILDEPTAGVDELAKEDIYKMLQELNRTITILIISHDTANLMGFLNRVIYINKTAHMHEHHNEGQAFSTGDSCPIDWFIQGEVIQKELLETKGES
ncbi:MAG: metal ABC transporter ATP-binding protein [Vallitaleaceae bacterium]|jgi:zinc transport system ATP-binding protein|nr:metal ABC transporter ATP-binding protein [Vallitaleaceae bacterium]